MSENGTKNKEVNIYRGKTPGYSGLKFFDDPLFEGYSPLIKSFFNDPIFELMDRSPLREMYAEMPKIDIYRKDKNLVLTADFPGVKKEDIKLTVDESKKTLELIVNSSTETKDEKKEYLRKERREIHYHNIYDVSSVDIKNITSKYDNGVLEVTLPLTDVKEDVKNKRIIEVN